MTTDSKLPTVYVDTSLAIEYFAADGVEADERPPERARAFLEGPAHDAIRELLKSDGRWNAIVKCRHRYLRTQTPSALLVTSPLAVLELSEWYAENIFKDLAVTVGGPAAVQRRGKKDVGELLAKLLKHVEADGNHSRNGLAPSAHRRAFEDMFIVPSFLESHGLRGVAIQNLDDFAITGELAYGAGQLLAYLQLGLADILHLCAAKHLGCAYFASLDTDFKRAKSILNEDFALRLLSTPEELEAVLVH